jgi:hypothetical protein
VGGVIASDPDEYRESEAILSVGLSGFQFLVDELHFADLEFEQVCGEVGIVETDLLDLFQLVVQLGGGEGGEVYPPTPLRGRSGCIARHGRPPFFL